MSLAGHAGTVALALPLCVSGVAQAQTLRDTAVACYLVDYTTHSHGFGDYAPNLPRFAEGTPWWRVKTLLMGGRRAHALYLLGDDRIHLFPARVGVFGWGASAGVEF